MALVQRHGRAAPAATRRDQSALDTGASGPRVRRAAARRRGAGSGLRHADRARQGLWQGGRSAAVLRARCAARRPIGLRRGPLAVCGANTAGGKPVRRQAGARCARCEKPAVACVCDRVTPLPTSRRVLILRHPQEPGEDVGSGATAAVALERAVLRTGLSWPNLRRALGERCVEPRRWIVLYLGSATAYADLLAALPSVRTPADRLVLLDRRGMPREPGEAQRIREESAGLVVLDGSWRQAKALWWRNPWLLKLQRAVLRPPHRSLYGRVRREPRRECLATIESIAYALEALGEPATVRASLIALFREQVARMRRAGLRPRRRGRRGSRGPR
ncbi:MAG: DTW domain-containing protein [Planctomycetota bacterium]|nr:MAG: DTW domain-containing protein [Planctomycetota bacterium]